MDDAYLAGFIDGQGTLGIAVTRRLPSPRHQAGLVIGSTSREALERVRDYVGAGSVIPYDTPHRRTWRYALRETAALAALLERLRPRLIVKAEQADILLDFLHGERRPGVPLSDEEVERRQELVERLRALSAASGHDAESRHQRTSPGTTRPK